MKLLIPSAAFAAAALTFSSCENPADNTADAKVSELKDVAVSSGETFVLTEGSAIGFVGSKVTGSHTGGFESFDGSFVLTEGVSVPGSGEFTIDMSSTFSDDDKLTDHLKGPDFFDVEKFPSARFVMTSAEMAGEGSYKVSGNLKLHGVEKNITFPAAATRDGEMATITAEFDINRKDFGIVYPGRTDDLIRDEVVIKLDLRAKAE